MTKLKVDQLDNIFAEYLCKPAITREINLLPGTKTIVKDLPPKRRAGIYVLKYSNGHYYVGKSEDVSARYRAHYKKSTPNRTITRLYFRPTAMKDLYGIEAEVFHNLMSRIVKSNGQTTWLTNEILFVTAFEKYKHLYPEGFSFADLIGQRKALVKLDLEETKDNIFIAPVQKKVSQLVQALEARFNEFRKLPYSAKIFDLLTLYVKLAIPNAESIAGTNWICEYKPTSPVAVEVIYTKFFLNNQVVLSASTWNDKPRIILNLDKSGLPGSKDKIKALSSKGLEAIDHSLNTPQKGAISLNISNISTAFSLLNDPKIVKAILQSNEKLISKDNLKPDRIHDEEFAQLLLN